MPNLQHNVLDRAGREEIECRRGLALGIHHCWLRERSAAGPIGAGVNLSNAGSDGQSCGLIGGNVVSEIRVGNVSHEWGELHHIGVIRRPGKGTNRASDIVPLTVGVGLDGHALTLREAGLLNREAVERYALYDNVVDWRMNIDQGRCTAGGRRRGGNLNHAYVAGSADLIESVPVTGAGGSAGSDVQNGCVTRGIAERGTDTASGGILCGRGENNDIP